jgi:hypothetical protein
MPHSSRKAAPRQVTAKRRESIAAFEEWQRNWSTSVHGADPVAAPADSGIAPPKRAISKQAAAHHSAHSR